MPTTSARGSKPTNTWNQLKNKQKHQGAVPPKAIKKMPPKARQKESSEFSVLMGKSETGSSSKPTAKEEDLDRIDGMLDVAESAYNKWRHPDPYIVPWAPGGSKFCRNPTPPAGIEIVYNYGKEDND